MSCLLIVVVNLLFNSGGILCFFVRVFLFDYIIVLLELVLGWLYIIFGGCKIKKIWN